MCKLVWIFLILPGTLGLYNDFKMPKNGSAITDALSDIILNYYKNNSNTVNLIHESSGFKGKEMIEDTINELLYALKGKIIVQLGSSQESTSKTAHNILFCDNYESFQKILLAMNPDQFEYQGFYLIVLSYSEDLNETMTNIFNDLWLRYIVNVNILWMPAENNKEAMMYTYYPYTPFYCSEAKPVQLDQFRDGKWLTNADCFPNKMVTMHGCPLRVASFSNPPFMILVFHGEYFDVDGIEGRMLGVLSRKMNFSVQLFNSAQAWGELHENGSSTGAAKMIMDKSVNLTLGYFAKTLIGDTFMTSSDVYYSSNLLWVIPPGHEISSFAKLLKPFKYKIWTCFLVVLVCAFAVVFFLKSRSKELQNFVFGEGIHDPCLNIFNIVIGGSLNRTPVRNFARAILTVFMLYCFIVQNAYKGGLFKFMQMTVREPLISTTDELIAKNFSFYMFKSSALSSAMEMPKVLERATFILPAEFNLLLLESTDPNFEGALLSTADHLAYRNIKAYPDRFYNHAAEKIFTNNLVIYFVKESCFKHRVDQLIAGLLNGGFLMHWSSIFIDKNFLKQQETANAVPLALKKLKGSFQVLAVCLGVSFSTFLLEIAVKKIKF